MMPDFKPRNSSFYKIAFIVAWICLWFIPWQGLFPNPSNLYLVLLLDMFRLGIAMVGFILPGVFLYILVEQKPGNVVFRPGVLPIGFALSVAIIGIVGLVGRVSGWSFVTVKYIFALIGLGELILLTVINRDVSLPKIEIAGIFHNIAENVSLFLALILAASMAFNGYQFFIDDTTYVAYLMNWQFSTTLGFNNIVHPTGVIESERFWLALYPIGQALLSELSDIPGLLLLSNYLELFLVPLAVVTAYWFARSLGLTRKAAGFSVLIQVILYTMMVDESWAVGFWFFQNMAEDKVIAAFILSPVFIAFVCRFFHLPSINNIALIILVGVALMLTHPVILFLACAIAGGLALFSWLLKKNSWREVAQLFIIFAVLMMPYVAIRLYGHFSQSTIPFNAESVSSSYQAEKYVRVVNNTFYGLNPDVLKLIDFSPEGRNSYAFEILRLLPVGLALAAGVIAFRRLSEGPLHWYVVICVALVAFATIPYTGWILGYITSARLISRVSWFSPLGLVGGLVILPFVGWLLTNPLIVRLRKPSTRSSTQRDKTVMGMLTILVFTGILLILLVLPRVPFYFEVLDNNRQLTKVGAYIDQNTDRYTTVIALNRFNILKLPGVSVNSSLISFREEQEYNPHNYYFSIDEIHERLDASNTIRSLESSILPDKRCHLLQKYDVRFVLAESNNAEQYKQLTSGCKKKPMIVFSTQDLVLLEYR